MSDLLVEDEVVVGREFVTGVSSAASSFRVRNDEQRTGNDEIQGSFASLRMTISFCPQDDDFVLCSGLRFVLRMTTLFCPPDVTTSFAR